MDISTATLIAENLLEINAIKLNPGSPFTWASGMKSPIYCDNRMLLSYPKIRNNVKKALVECSKQFGDFDVVAGVATSGIPLATMVADELGKPLVYIRGKAKAHGRKNLIEGHLEQGASVLVVEDLISTGGSALVAVKAVEEAGGNVNGVLAIFSYSFQKAIDNFSNANCKLETLANFDVLLDAALKRDYINKEDLKSILKWRINPEQWLNQTVQ